MERTESKNIMLYKVELNRVFINDSGVEDHFPVEYEGEDYFGWHTDIDERLQHFNSIVLTTDMIDVGDGVEKCLFGIEVDRHFYNEFKNDDDFYNMVCDTAGYRFLLLKNEYSTCTDIMDKNKSLVIDKAVESGIISNEIAEQIKEEVEDFYLEKQYTKDVYEFCSEIGKKYFKDLDPNYGEKKENPLLDFLFELVEANEIELY